jgi:hypothetical protein
MDFEHVARMKREWNPGWISWISFHFIQATSFASLREIFRISVAALPR